MSKCENEIISKSANQLISTLVSLILTLILLLPNSIIAQKADSVIKIKADTVRLKDSVHVKKHSPKKATIMSAIIPGLGQVYNHKYWKLPILYGGIAAIGYFINFNLKNYRSWKNQYNLRQLNPPKDNYPFYSDANLLDLENYYRRDLELTYIIGGLVYILNILDAAVDANLYDYNMNSDLSFRVEPIWYPSYNKNVNFAMKLTFKLK